MNETIVLGDSEKPEKDVEAHNCLLAELASKADTPSMLESTRLSIYPISDIRLTLKAYTPTSEQS